MADPPPVPLGRCPDCGREVSRRADRCPQCGCPLGPPRRRRDPDPSPKARRSGLTAGLIAGGVVGLVGCCGIGVLVFGLAAGRNPLAPAIVGKWQDDANPGHTIEFASNGAVTERDALGVHYGTYKAVDGGRIRMTQGILGLQVETTWRQTISYDRLTMASDSAFAVSFTFRRVH